MIRLLTFAFSVLLLAHMASEDASAARLGPAEPLTNAHLAALLAPVLPPLGQDRRRRLDFAAPILPLANPNQSASELRLVSLDLDAGSGRFSGEIHVRLSSGTEGRLALLGRVHDEVLLPTLSRNIAKGERIEREMLTLVWFADRHLARDVIVDTDQLAELEAARRIPAGRPIREIDIREPRLVRRGEIVELFYQRGALRIRTMARAKHSGGLGDLVALTNIESGKDLRALVTGRKRAKILDAGVGSP